MSRQEAMSWVGAALNWPPKEGGCVVEKEEQNEQR